MLGLDGLDDSSANQSQLPKTRLVAYGRMVFSTSELEGKYGSHGECDCGNCRNSVERERGAGG